MSDLFSSACRRAGGLLSRVALVVAAIGTANHGIVSAAVLTPDFRCLSTPRSFFNIATDIEAVLGATIYES